MLFRNCIKFKQRKFRCALNAPALSHYYFNAEEKEAKENQENLQEKEFDFKFTIAANLITGTEIKLRNGWKRLGNLNCAIFLLSVLIPQERKDGCSTHKLHTISFKTITNLPNRSKKKKANVRKKKFQAAKKIRKQSFTD